MRRFGTGLGIVFSAMTVALVIGCGGGGGASLTTLLAAVSPGGGTPIPDDPGTSAPGCPLDSYSPNYLAESSATRVHYWPQFALRYTILNDWSVSGESMADLARQGVSDWVGQTGGAVTLSEVALEASPDVQIEFVDTIVGYPTALGLTEYNVIRATSAGARDRAISRDPGDNSYLPVRVQILRDAAFLARQPDFVRQTTFHEIGHVLFMGGHSLAAADAMFASLDPRIPVPNVTARDLNSLYAAYCGVFRWAGRAPKSMGLRPGEVIERRTIACSPHDLHVSP